MSATPHSIPAGSSNGKRGTVVKDQPRRSPPSQQKMSLFQKFFSLRSADNEEDFYNGDKSEQRRKTIQDLELDKSLCYDRLTLAGDSDEAMMAKASADCLIDQPEKIFLTKPRPCSTNSSPSPRKANRHQTPSAVRNTLSPEINGNVSGDTVQKGSNKSPTQARSTNLKQGESVAPRNQLSSGNPGGNIDNVSRNNNNNQKSSSNRATTRPSANAGRFQGRLQRGNRFANSGGGGSGKSFTGGSFKRRSMKMAKSSSLTSIKVDVTQPLTFPNTPETILEYHKRKPILDENEEWLIVELNEYECLVDGLDILKIIAKHSKFFEVEPDELWQEFFDFVDEIPAYDEVVNFDIWQEFRDKKYAC